jgi:hypothetical protein
MIMADLTSQIPINNRFASAKLKRITNARSPARIQNIELAR